MRACYLVLAVQAQPIFRTSRTCKSICIRLMSAWKQLTIAQKAATFDTDDPKKFAEFADKFLESKLYTQGKAEPIRHALLFFLSPDYFERMVSIKDRQNIVGHFKNLLSDTTKNQLHKNIKKNKPLLIDQAIFEIRQSLESAYPQDSVDFYLEPIQVSGSWVSVEEVQRRLAENNKSTPSTEANHLPQAVTEGEQRFYQYYGKSRKALRKPKLESFRKQHGFLFCECCDDRGGRYPANFGKAIFEVHHRKSIADYSDKGEETTHGDLAVLCANCHNAIHASDPLMSVEDFKAECGFE